MNYFVLGVALGVCGGWLLGVALTAYIDSRNRKPRIELARRWIKELRSYRNKERD